MIDASGHQSIREIATRGFGGTARLDPSSDSVILTTVGQNEAHNLTSVSLADGTVRQLTSNTLPGISFAGLEVLPNQSILFSRQESNSDLWLIEFSR